MVCYGHKTVRAGQRAAVWSRNGEFKIIDGPKRVSLVMQRIEFLQEYTADEKAYLEVRKRAGHVEILQGPCSIFRHPVEDESITVKQATVIDASEALVVYKGGKGQEHDVVQKIVRGPARFIPEADEWIKERLKEHIADQNSYMEVRKRAGPVEIMHGPCQVFLDPMFDESVRVLPATMIDASEALVVYKHSTDKQTSVERRIVRGPARFIPAPDEWVHNFEWSGMPKDGSKTTYQPRALKFNKLKVIPMTAYHNVNEVRTNDDTLITVKLMLFFDLIDIERMLDATPDPIGDFINAASSDVIAFCSAVSYETFLNETHKLNDVNTFTGLKARADHIGYSMSKVVFRGFQAGDKLQAMHDNAIQERTRLRLLEETQAQEQRATDLRLAAEQQRATKEAELKINQARLAADISLATQKANLAEQSLIDEAEQERARLKHESALAELRSTGDAEVEIEQRKLEVSRAQNEEQLRVMREMKQVGVDITQVLVAQHHVPGNLIRLETDAARSDKKEATEAGTGKGLIGALQLNL